MFKKTASGLVSTRTQNKLLKSVYNQLLRNQQNLLLSSEQILTNKVYNLKFECLQTDMADYLFQPPLLTFFSNGIEPTAR